MQVHLQKTGGNEMRRIGNSGCVSREVYGALNQRHSSKAQEGKTFAVYKVKKDGNLCAKPAQNHLGHTRFTQEEATNYVRHLEDLNPGRKWVVKKVG